MNDEEIAKQTGQSALKLIVNQIPIIGPILVESFEIRGRIKQERINTFVTELGEALLSANSANLNIHQINSDDFGDFFENLLRNVAANRSEEKRLAFKNLLVNQLMNPQPIDYAELYSSIIGSLHEKQLPILKALNDCAMSSYIDYQTEIIGLYEELRSVERELKMPGRFYDDEGESSYAPEMTLLENRISDLKKQIASRENVRDEQKRPPHAKEMGIQEYEYLFLRQDLCSKGLAYDRSFEVGMSPFDYIEITQIGADLVASIQS